MWKMMPGQALEEGYGLHFEKVRAAVTEDCRQHGEI
jgi:hypothetical protein